MTHTDQVTVGATLLQLHLKTWSSVARRVYTFVAIIYCACVCVTSMMRQWKAPSKLVFLHRLVLFWGHCVWLKYLVTMNSCIRWLISCDLVFLRPHVYQRPSTEWVHSFELYRAIEFKGCDLTKALESFHREGHGTEEMKLILLFNTNISQTESIFFTAQIRPWGRKKWREREREVPQVSNLR